MFANFHSSGNSPQLNDLLKIWVREGAIFHAVSFRSRDGIPSGSVALVVSSAKSVLPPLLLLVGGYCPDVEGEDDGGEGRSSRLS
ncbi:Hypothetical predicted protein [Paramuricea clavata]|uniref:Uncharacterized protein n=1 Tax=Paramuricea clavata TaxID=317549 RepID=A0A7D9HY02_PARCT|nr:Hypothetical predicted protein [Paramuricea clavata]